MHNPEKGSRVKHFRLDLSGTVLGVSPDGCMAVVKYDAYPEKRIPTLCRDIAPAPYLILCSDGVIRAA